MKNFLLLSLLVFFFAAAGLCQTIITPSKELNQQFASGEIDPLEFFAIYEEGGDVTVAPEIPEGWTWFLILDLPVGDESISLAFKDGRIYTSDNFKTNHRRKKYRKDISGDVQSDAVVYALYTEKNIEKNAVFFVYKEDGGAFDLQLTPAVWGEPKNIQVQVSPNDLQFVLMQKLPEESNPFYFEESTAKRDTICVNSGWKFSKDADEKAAALTFDDKGWQEVTIPHCWNTTDVFDTRNINDGYYINERYYRGPAWYRRSFTFDRELAGKKMFLEFEGAFQKADVWLNDKYLGNHKGGYTGFVFDVTDIIAGENVLTVRVDNSYDYSLPPHSADYFMYGGLYRDVRFIITNDVYIGKEIRVTTPNVSHQSATVGVEMTVEGAGGIDAAVSVVSNLVNEFNEIVSTKSVALDKEQLQEPIALHHSAIQHPALWSPDSPSLYRLVNTVYIDGEPVDKVITPVGLRWFSFDADSGFYLNGERLFLKGVNKHQDYFGYGIAVPDSLQKADLVLLKEMGTNFIRLAHYPQDPSVLQACDELGIIVWQEIPVVNSVGGSAFLENARAMLKEMIVRDFNHPSIVLWGISNESVMGFANRDAYENAFATLENLNQYAKQLDPTRLTVQAHNDMMDDSIGDITDVIGRNRYFGWYEMPMNRFAEELEKQRSEHPEWITIISEYGVGSKLGHHVDDPQPFDFSEDYQMLFHEYYWETIANTPWIAGSLIWASIDFGSITKSGNIPAVNQKGLFDISRRKKDVYYFYKSQWSEELMAYIVSHRQELRYGKPGETVELKVYSNGDTVELFVNGKSYGEKTGETVYRWEIPFAEGATEVRAIARKGFEVSEDKMTFRFFIEDN